MVRPGSRPSNTARVMANTFGVGFGSGDTERAACRVDAGHSEAAAHDLLQQLDAQARITAD